MARFYATVNHEGDFFFYTKSVPSNSEYDVKYYCSYDLYSSPNASEAAIRVVFSSEALISVVRRNGQVQVISPSSILPSSDNYHRATLDWEGVFTQYYHPKNFGNSPGWQVAKSWPDDICIYVLGETGSGACGYNSACEMQNGRPVCTCPSEFSLVDPLDRNGDCKPNFPQICRGGENGSVPQDNEYRLEMISDIDWPLNDYQKISPCSVEECQRACLDDCLGGAAIHRVNTCWKKKLPLSNGKVQKDSQAKPLNPVRDPSSSSNLRCFTYKELELATDGFKEELGRGSFGIVYKGEIPLGSQNIVAVKKLDRMFQDSEKEFKTRSERHRPDSPHESCDHGRVLRGGASPFACIRVHEQWDTSGLSVRPSAAKLEPTGTDRKGAGVLVLCVPIDDAIINCLNV
ncbi:G-type lectin S-receptor-like serine/threonine-protein kinase LECRK3 [Salvia splendens]|uniref:G-type lectin S-receptor-like serine/threonine-protein kinase LECRK3 n=1 Tax=Salvia splendens TaxID=180675 RepID=UPI001C253A9C|nr:G-type lectin S-receptor-like serine/threonine-protein kinase LECRK3 [Salvia splendens]